MTQEEIDNAFEDFAFAQRSYMQKLENLTAMARAALQGEPPPAEQLPGKGKVEQQEEHKIRETGGVRGGGNPNPRGWQ